MPFPVTNKFVLIVTAGTLFSLFSYFTFPTIDNKFLAEFLLLFNAGVELFIARAIVVKPEPKALKRVATIVTCVVGGIIRILLSFSYNYRYFGIIDTSTNKPVGDAINCFYFSLVTFTTLGYGDFRPQPDTRLLAGSEAILGYFALALSIAILTDLVGRYFGNPMQAARKTIR